MDQLDVVVSYQLLMDSSYIQQNRLVLEFISSHYKQKHQIMCRNRSLLGRFPNIVHLHETISRSIFWITQAAKSPG